MQYARKVVDTARPRPTGCRANSRSPEDDGSAKTESRARFDRGRGHDRGRRRRVGTAGAASRSEAPLGSATAAPTVEEENPLLAEVEPALFFEGEEGDESSEDQKTDSGKPGKIIDGSVGDGKPDGKRSLGGSGEMIELWMPDAGLKVLGVKIHGSRYGQPDAPKESFLIYYEQESNAHSSYRDAALFSVRAAGPNIG